MSSNQSSDLSDKKDNEATSETLTRAGRLITGPTGQPMIVKVDGQASQGAYALFEYSHAAGAAGPPAHVHAFHEEAFYIIEGQLTLAIDNQIITLSPGECWVVPRGSIHRPSNRSDQPVRYLIISSPPMDAFFTAMSDLVNATAGQPSKEALNELADRYDSTFVDLPETSTIKLHNEA
jgi:mannose-6-phosphate isomerase-like protein (cupin superfamily)